MNHSSKHKFTLDRIENDIAVLIDGKKQLDMPKRYLPIDAKEGDIVHLSITTDEIETKERSRTAKELLNEILSSK